MKTSRIPTGISELDRLVDGGFIKGKTYLVVGEPGTGKTIFGLQFLMAGLQQKEKGLYVTIDEKPTEVIEQAASLGWNLAPYIDAKEFQILDASAYFNTRAADELGKHIDVQRVLTDLNTYITRIGASRLVIDPVGPLIFSSDATARVSDQTRRLFYGLQAGGNTTNLLTTYAVARQVRGIEEYLASGTLVLEMERIKSRFIRTLTIEKMRSTALEPAQYGFQIQAGHGIVLQGAGERAD
ncbi:MAG TPA: ATPase domain-containing protein [Terriglobales bacterium]|nr:ATPase domain-containing protein [Terriglobales bacterium]